MSTEILLTEGIVGWAALITFALLIAAMALAFIRMAIGPSFADRVVAIDLLTIAMVALCAVYAVKADEAAFLDIAIALALVAFLGTVALARYAGRRDPPATGSEDSGEDSGAAPPRRGAGQ